MGAAIYRVQKQTMLRVVEHHARARDSCARENLTARWELTSGRPAWLYLICRYITADPGIGIFRFLAIDQGKHLDNSTPSGFALKLLFDSD